MLKNGFDNMFIIGERTKEENHIWTQLSHSGLGAMMAFHYGH